MLQMLTDAINLILIDTGNESYINNFTLKMLPPTTSEEVDRRENVTSKVSLVRDIMDIMSDIETPKTKLKILKSLLSDTITDSEVVGLIEEEIARLEAEEEIPVEADVEDDMSMDDGNISFSEDEPMNFGTSDFDTAGEVTSDTDVSTDTDTSSDEDSADATLPSPEELNVGDMSDATNPNLD